MWSACVLCWWQPCLHPRPHECSHRSSGSKKMRNRKGDRLFPCIQLNWFCGACCYFYLGDCTGVQVCHHIYCILRKSQLIYDLQQSVMVPSVESTAEVYVYDVGVLLAYLGVRQHVHQVLYLMHRVSISCEALLRWECYCLLQIFWSSQNLCPLTGSAWCLLVQLAGGSTSLPHYLSCVTIRLLTLSMHHVYALSSTSTQSAGEWPSKHFLAGASTSHC